MADAFGWERELLDRIAIHQYQNGLIGEVSKVLVGTMRSALTRLMEAGPLSSSQQAALVRTLANVTGVFGPAYAEIRKKIERSMLDLALVRGEAMSNRMRVAFEGVPEIEASLVNLSVEQAVAITRFPIQGLGIGEWWESEARRMTVQVRQIIQNGLLQGKSSSEIAAMLVRQQGVVKGANAYRSARGGATSLVRTITSAITSHTDLAVFRSGGDRVSESYLYRATYDERTTVICLGLDGRVFFYGRGFNPMPPMHFACRSTIIPLLNTSRMSPAVRERLEKAGMAVGEGKRSLRDYSDWLREKGDAVQNRVLGKQRAEWFRSGKIQLGELLNEDSRVLTLTQLRERLR